MYSNTGMSPRVRKNAPLISSLAKMTPRIRNAVLSTAKKELVLALVECAKNVILGTVPLTSTQLNQLRRYQKHITELVAPRTSLKRRKELLQTGGFVGLLVKPLLGLLGSALGGSLFGGR